MLNAGAIASTVLDLDRRSTALGHGGLLDSKSKQQMWTPARLNDGKLTSYGFGWFIEPLKGHRCISHSGSASGFSASIQRFPDDKLAVILLTNTDEQIATRLAKTIAGFSLPAGAN